MVVRLWKDKKNDLWYGFYGFFKFKRDIDQIPTGRCDDGYMSMGTLNSGLQSSRMRLGFGKNGEEP